MKRNPPATKKKKSVPCDAVMGRMQCTTFKDVGDIKDTNGQFQLTTINLRRLAEIDFQSKVIYWLISD